MGFFGRGAVTSRTAKGTKKLDEDDVTDASNNEVDYEDFCQRLEENDPSIKTVTLGEPGITDPKAVALGQCMEGNTNVTKIVIDFSYLDRFCGSVFCFLDFIEKSAGLRSIELRHADLTNTKVCSTLLVFLPAMSKNANIDDFVMKCRQATFYDIFTAFWYTLAYSLNTLFGGNKGSTIRLLQNAVAVSLCQCQSMEVVKFEYLPEEFLVNVLPDLVKVKVMQSLYVAPKHYSVKTFRALGSLAENSNSLEELHLKGYRFTSTRFQPLADGIKAASSSLKGLHFVDCRFNGGATTIFENMFSGNAKLNKLTIGPNVRFYRAAAIINILSHKNGCKLTVLDLSEHQMQNGADVVNLLKCLFGEDEEEEDEEAENMSVRNLERLSLHTIQSEDEVEALKSAVANLAKLKEITISNLLSTAEQRGSLLDVFKCNASLQKCVLGGETLILNQHGAAAPRRKIDRTASLKRKESFRGYLSDDEIEQINAKDEFLQLNKSPSKLLESEDESNWEDMDTTTNNNSGDSGDSGISSDEKGLSDTDNGDTTKGSVESALNRHSLGHQVRDLLKD